MTKPSRPNASGRRISGRAQSDHIRDPYQAQRKPHEPAVCTDCGAIYHGGRWQWGNIPEAAEQERCPACRRIADALPAGIVTLHGRFGGERRQEIVGLARNVEAGEKAEHPLNRIIAITDLEDGIEITTTDIHLPQRLGNALKHALGGEYEMHFDEGGYFNRVEWRAPG